MNAEVDWGRLQTQEEKEKYNIEVKNKYSSLSQQGIEQAVELTPEEQTDKKWELLRDSLKSSWEKVPKKEKKAKKPWITNDILDLMTGRKKSQKHGRL